MKKSDGLERQASGRMAYFILQTQLTEEGEYIPCIAVEGMSGYYKTDWAWGKDLAIAEELAEKKNTAMGISKQEALKIVLSSMRKIVTSSMKTRKK